MTEEQKTQQPQLGSLVGRWFHSFTENKEVRWQGQIIAQATPTSYLVELYSWMSGGPTNQQFVDVAEMKDWFLYETNDDMNFNYRHRLQKKANK